MTRIQAVKQFKARVDAMFAPNTGRGKDHR
jgi:hypothetical protein